MLSLQEINSFIKEHNTIINAFQREADDAHNDTNQMYDDKPYSAHLHMVSEFALDFIDKVALKEEHILPILFGAHWHDTIEDARLTYNDVLKRAKKYMDEQQAIMATEIVYALTNEKGRNREERANDKYYEGIRTTPYAPFVKMCDRLANMSYSHMSKSSMAKKYQQELPHFIESIYPIQSDYSEFYIPEEMINTAKSFK